MKKFVILFLFISLIGCGQLISSPKHKWLPNRPFNPPANIIVPNTEQLKTDFIKTYDDDFTIVNDELLTDTYGTIWLLTIRAEKSGHFIIRYLCENTNQKKDIGFADCEYSITVGEKGSKRFYMEHWNKPYGTFYPDMCVGDKITLTIHLERIYDSFKFLKGNLSKGLWKEFETAFERVLSNTATIRLTNPVEPELTFLGQTKSGVGHVAHGFTSYWDAVFEAKTPGKLNLYMEPNKFSDIIRSKDNPFRNRTFHIIIVPKSDSVDIRASYESVHKYNSYEGRNYQQKTIYLRPGDLIKVHYFIKSYYNDSKEDTIEPIIKRLPFKE